jgi:YVTN family beta-propeller protein
MRLSVSLVIWLVLSFAVHADAFNGLIATIGVGNSPAGIAITPDNRFAYVANNNNASIVGADTVSVINLETNTVVKTISDASFNEPYTVTINAAGTLAYVTNSNSTTITVITIATNTVSAVIGGFDGPSGMVIVPNSNIAYVNNYGGPGGVGSGNGTTVRVVNLTTNTIVGAPITVGFAPASLAVTPNGAYVYVINYVDGNPGTGTISIIQTSSNTVVGTIPGFSGPFAIAISADGDHAYVTNFGSNNFSPVGTTVTVVDLHTNRVSDTISLGTQPSGIAIAPNGHFVYATNYNTLYLGAGFTDLTPGQGTVNIIDVRSNRVLPQVLVTGASPADVAISHDGTRAYVTNYSDNTVSVFYILDTMWLNIRR